MSLSIWDMVGDDVDPMEAYDFTMMAVKLQNDTILTSIAEIDEDTLCLMLPFSLEWEYDEYGSATGFNFVKFIPGTDDLYYLIRREQVVSMGNMSKEYADAYERAMDSYFEKIAAKSEDSKTIEPQSEERGTVVEFKKKDTLH